MNSKVLLLVTLVGVAAADRRPYSYSAPEFSSEEFGPANYNFDWAVQHSDSGNNFGHQEARDGHDTQGSYYVQLPDGRLQTVRFTVQGDSGFLPEVSYEGEARYPDSFESFESFESRESRGYAPPRPVYG
ncbi:pro-resilin-like [Penaeus vannamei]|uniref:pro-resilin-like n=1 Tax=Penaeus vannamei TaxID=6689 RepID=UPI00387FAE9B